jgi:hypothetical protein
VWTDVESRLLAQDLAELGMGLGSVLFAAPQVTELSPGA